MSARTAGDFVTYGFGGELHLDDGVGVRAVDGPGARRAVGSALLRAAPGRRRLPREGLGVRSGRPSRS
ncbi:hypothetical protein JIX56_40445 [Streptomyces sp. CA-210063]|uniref:hypothetical protein n=1 Tax=Streptomyces sp. CA-210063 TaxID=2801029 RepID=UPI00214C4A71|nr:hypothetical protein [Streptomyces sp. CA-210063]UUU35624.1 hypothetical protein JIX56_40445 [Streptomyces sp. CA-210063]